MFCPVPRTDEKKADSNAAAAESAAPAEVAETPQAGQGKNTHVAEQGKPPDQFKTLKLARTPAKGEGRVGKTAERRAPFTLFCRFPFLTIKQPEELPKKHRKARTVISIKIARLTSACQLPDIMMFWVVSGCVI